MSIQGSVDAQKSTQNQRADSLAPFWIKLKPSFNFLFAFSFLAVLFTYINFLPTTFKTSVGEKKIISLSDGSKIHLNSLSDISHHDSYNIKDRTISLNGEAYFEVMKGEIPFIVKTEYGNVKVLGTSFNIYNRDDGFELGVNEGKVNFSKNLESQDLIKGQILQNSSKINNINILEKVYSNYPDWKNNKIYCNQTSLNKICSEIERIFNITVTFSNPEVGDLTISGTINTQTLDNALSTISLLSQHEFKLSGDQCTIL